MLPHELIHNHGVQLLLLAPLCQREAILASDVVLNANLLFENLLGEEDEVGILEAECRSDISLCDMSPGKSRNYCGVLPILSNELALLLRIDLRNPRLPCLLLDEN